MDFDIDKAFDLMYSVSDSGLLVGWSPLFDYSSYETLVTSQELPTPNKDRTLSFGTDEGTIIMQEGGSGYDVSDLINSYIDLSSKEKASGFNPIYTAEKIRVVAKLIGIINNIKLGLNGKAQISFTLNSIIDEVTSNRLRMLVSDINEHQQFNISADAARNVVMSNIRKTINDIENMESAYSPIDMSCITDPIKLYVKSQGVHKNLYDGFTVSEITEENATGKSTVGVMANGVKAFFTLTQYFDRYFASKSATEINGNDPEMFRKTLKLRVGISEKNPFGEVIEYHRSTISDIKLSEQLKEILKASLMEVMKTPEEKKRFEEMSAFSEDDASLVISAFVSLATDNAKELALAKINAGLNLASLHIYLTIMGVEPDVIVRYTTSPWFKMMAQLLTPNMLTSEYRSVAEPDFELLAALAVSKAKEMSKGDDRLFVNLQEEYIKDIEQLEDIYYASKEMKDMTGVLGINQGVSANLDGILSFKDKLSRAWRSLQDHNPDFREKNPSELLQMVNNGEMTKELFNKIMDRKKRPMSKVQQVHTTHEWNGVPIENLTLKSDKIKMLKRLIAEHPEYGEYLYKDIDFEKFFEDEKYRQFIIDVYDVYKHTFNVYDVIWKSDTFGAMIRATYKATKELSTLSKKFDFQFSKAKDWYMEGYNALATIGYKIVENGEEKEHTLKESGFIPVYMPERPGEYGSGSNYYNIYKRYGQFITIASARKDPKIKYVSEWKIPTWDSKMAKQAGSYFDEVGIRMFFHTKEFNPSGKFAIDPEMICEWYNETFVEKDKKKITVKDVYTGTIKSREDQLKFLKSFVENYLYRALLASPKYNKNEFVKSLILKKDKDQIRKLCFKMSMSDMSSDSEITMALSIKNAFNELADVKITLNGNNDNLNLNDLFYLYNLIVNKDRFGQYALTSVFSDYIMRDSTELSTALLNFQIEENNYTMDLNDKVNFVLFMLQNRMKIKDADGDVIGSIVLYTKDRNGNLIAHEVKDPLFVSDLPAAYDYKKISYVSDIVNLIKNGDLILKLIC